MAYSYDDRDREFRQSPPPRPPRKEDNDLGSWILIIFLFIVASVSYTHLTLPTTPYV